MKKVFLFEVAILLLGVSTICTQASANDPVFISKVRALSLVKQKLNLLDADYYYIDKTGIGVTSSNGIPKLFIGGPWKFFVDAEPQKGWEHKCFIVTVPMKEFYNIPPTVFVEELRLPPNKKMTPIEVKDRFGLRKNETPRVPKQSLTNDVSEAAKRTHVVIISGGYSMISNYARYWNDCSYLYQTLVNKYSIPKEQISLLISDGTDPSLDMNQYGRFISSPLDLDFDGIPDTQYAATRNNVGLVFQKLSQKIEDGDHLFIYVIDHGGTNDKQNQSYICLWNEEILQDYELASMITPITANNANVNVVLGQCFSGGFVDNLCKVGCVVATASTGDEYSWACPDIPYDEFVYQWTKAINEKDHLGNSVISDIDKNGKITMDEAFTYAKTNDRCYKEHPQYKSIPLSIGEDLSFTNLPLDIDLYIKDNAEDTGKEPNITTDNFWSSPDIWVRNTKDDIPEHENPYFTENHIAAQIYVRVHNRGKKDYKRGKYYMHTYWAKASTGLTTRAWNGLELYNTHITGEHLRAVPIPDISAGSTAIVNISWALPSDFMDSMNKDYEDHHFCILARIMDSFFDYEFDPRNVDLSYYNVVGSNDVAQKNISIITPDKVLNGTDVFIRNIYKEQHKYQIEVRANSIKDEELFSKADVSMEMTPLIFEAWKRGGAKAKAIGYHTEKESRQITFLSKESRLYDVSMNSKDFEKVTMKFNFKEFAQGQGETYTIDLLQRDENGTIVGGETFLVKQPVLSETPLNITTIDLNNGTVQLSIDSINGDKIRWYDTDDKEIGKLSHITVKPTIQNKRFTAISRSLEGVIKKESITLALMNGMKSISPTIADSYINVEFFYPIEKNGTSIRITPITHNGTEVINYNLLEGAQGVQIDTSKLSKGFYIISYIVDGKIINSMKFQKD